MAYQVLINGVDRTKNISLGSLRIDDVINDQINSVNFVYENYDNSGIPTKNQLIQVYQDTLIFAGVITNVNRFKEAGKVVADIKAVDYTFELDRNLVHKTYLNMTDKQIIESIVSTYCSGSGITTNNVETGVTINQISFNYIQPSQAIRQIAERAGRYWYIDYNKDIHYFAIDNESAPFNLTDDSTIYVGEGMQSAPSGTLVGLATYDSGNRRVQLTTLTTHNAGNLEYTKTLANYFVMESVVSMGGGSGGDGVFFYFGCSSTPSDISNSMGGYAVNINTWQSRIEIRFNGSVVTFASIPNYRDLQRRTFRVEFNKSGSNTNIQVFIDKQNGNAALLNWNENNRTLPGNKLGWCSKVGALNDLHYIHSAVVSTKPPDYEALEVTDSMDQIKNRVYVRGGTKLSDFTSYKEKGDGEKRQFKVPDKPHDVTVKVNGVTKSLGIKNIDTSGYDWYLNFQEKYVDQDAGGTTLSASDTFEIIYKYDIPILVALEDSASILEHGVKEFPIFDKSISTTQAARERATAELTDYANSLRSGSFTTYTDGFRSGQTITINLSEYSVNDDFIIQRVGAQVEMNGRVRYDVTFASAKSIGVIKFLIMLLEANKNLIELDDQEVIDELFNLTDSINPDSLYDVLTIDSAGAYSTWASGNETTPKTVARWDLFQWG